MEDVGVVATNVDPEGYRPYVLDGQQSSDPIIRTQNGVSEIEFAPGSYLDVGLGMPVWMENKVETWEERCSSYDDCSEECFEEYGGFIKETSFEYQCWNYVQELCVAPVMRSCDSSNSTWCKHRRRDPLKECNFWDEGIDCAAGSADVPGGMLAWPKVDIQFWLYSGCCPSTYLCFILLSACCWR